MKLAVTIPAYDEEETIGKVIEEIPREIAGVDNVDVLVINDGSTDNTIEEAKKAGADKIISFKRNKGLATAFRVGLETALKEGADIVVNTDADFQYNQTQIPDLIKPILKGEADIVLGSRFKGGIEYMSVKKKWGNKLATWVTGVISGYPVSDAQTGFRAFSREAALRMNVMSDYTYVQETIIQAINNKLIIVEIPVDFRKREGESRLISNIFSYAKRAGYTILITYLNYKPLRTFLVIGGLIFALGFAVGLRVLIHYLITGVVSPYYPSTILATVLVIIGFLGIILGLIAEIIGTNRKIQEDILYRLKERK